MRSSFLSQCFSLLESILLVALPAHAAPAEDEPPKPASHSSRVIEQWNVRIDDRLITGPAATEGERALKLLAARLLEIELVVPEPALSKLREVTIQMDLSHGHLHTMQYHPSADWLKANGYSESLAQCVHIPEVSRFLSPFENHRMPWMLLHELAHSYHDRVLGFDDPRIAAAWENFRDSGRYQSVLTINGAQREHYALTNAREFFAEMTECYFGTNDFYPFVAGELQRDEPEIYNLLRDIWGPLPAQR
jgi:hypothetical protein